MPKLIFYLLSLVAFLAILLPSHGRSASPPTPVLVELFTSEGCSSCPPADRLLRAIENEKTPGAEVIVLSEHVDYWDSLGWRDPFSNAQFTKRQRDYARLFNIDGPYTPQMVVNGRAEFIGNSGKLAYKEITKAVGRPAASIHMGPIGIDLPSVATVQLSVQDIPQTSPKDELEVMLAVTETGLKSQPRKGENAGTALEHTGVVRSLSKIGRVESGAFATKAQVTLDPGWSRPSLRIVAFVQEKKSRIVWGAAQAPLEPSAH